MNKFLILAGRSTLAFVVVSLLVSLLLTGIMWIDDAVRNSGINFALSIRAGIVAGGIAFFASLIFGLSRTPAIPEKE